MNRNASCLMRPFGMILAALAFFESGLGLANASDQPGSDHSTSQLVTDSADSKMAKEQGQPRRPRKNILLICVDDLRPELSCFGKRHIKSPNIDRLAAEGTLFLHHYVQAPTCGASRYTMLTGRYGGPGNHALFSRSTNLKSKSDPPFPSMPAWFRQQGYTTVSVGKVSHHPGGRGGSDWNDPKQLEMPNSWDRHLLEAGPWKHPRGWMHGLANGEIRIKAGKMDVIQAIEGPDSIYPDGVTIPQALDQLEQLAEDDEKPFFLAVGILRPHLPFGAPRKYLDSYRDVNFPAVPHSKKPSGKTTWHGSGEFMKYNRWGKDPNKDDLFSEQVRRHYAACVSYADAQVGRLLDRTRQLELDKDTVVVLWGDHGWHLGEHAVWGKHTLFEESLRSPLIIRCPGIGKPEGRSSAIVETLDLFPTLCELSGNPTPDFVQGRSLVPVLKDPTQPGHDAYSYHNRARSIRTRRYRLIQHQGGHIELYDHASPEKETRNISIDHPDIVAMLSGKINERLGGK